MPTSLYLVALAQPDEDFKKKVLDQYAETAQVVDNRLAFIYTREISTSRQVIDRLGIAPGKLSGVVVEMIESKYGGVLPVDVVEWLIKVENERK